MFIFAVFPAPHHNKTMQEGVPTDSVALEAIEKLGPREKWRIVKNIAVLGIAFMIHFTAFHGTSNLQSSLHNDGSLGAYTLACIYGSLILSNLFLPVLVIGYESGWSA